MSLVVLIVGVSGVAHADNVAAVWQSRYDGLLRVIRSKNFAKVQSLIADNYTWVMPGGQTKNRKESLAEFEPLFKMKRITGGETVVRVAKKLDHVDVTCNARWVLTGNDNKISHYHEVGVDTWKQSGGKWKVVRSVDRLSEMK